MRTGRAPGALATGGTTLPVRIGDRIIEPIPTVDITKNEISSRAIHNGQFCSDRLVGQINGSLQFQVDQNLSPGVRWKQGNARDNRYE